MTRHIKKLIYVALLLNTTYTASAQHQYCADPTAVNTIETDNFKINVSTVGISATANDEHAIYFKNDTGGLQNTIYSTGLWMGGYDEGNNLVITAQNYPLSGNGTDYTPGPLSDSIGLTDSITCLNFDQVWKVTEADIRDLITDFQDNGYVDNTIPQALLEWPGTGNPHFSSIFNFTLPAQDLAPFYDLNNDGIYDPNDGDYPVFEHGNPNAIPSQMTWSVYNDNGKIHDFTNSSLSLNMEIQTTTYLFECSGQELLDSVIFVKHKLINENAIRINDFRVGFFNDFDLGCYNDDRIGTDSTLNTIYVYNSDINDGFLCGQQHNNGFGMKPPVQAVTLLNTNIDRSSYITNGGTNPNMSDPTAGPGFYQLISGYWPSNSLTPLPITYGGTGFDLANPNAVPTDFVFPSYPTDASSSAWSMVSDTVLGGDYRMLMSVAKDSLLANANLEYDLAYTFMRDTSLNEITMTSLIPQVIPRVQQIYDDNFSSVACAQNTTLNVRSNQAQYANALITAFPNPAQNQITIDFQNVKGSWNVQLVDIMGRSLIQKNNINNTQTQLNVENLPAGIYFYQVTSEEGILIHTEKIQIQ